MIERVTVGTLENEVDYLATLNILANDILTRTAQITVRTLAAYNWVGACFRKN